MIPFAQLDPASLALWVNYEILRRSPNGKYYQPVIEAAACADLDAVSAAMRWIPTRPTWVRAMHLASIVWHEQRHFLDLTMTNYGARHFRNHFVVAMNVSAMMGDGRRTSVGSGVKWYAEVVS
jgi:hypothetical protein